MVLLRINNPYIESIVEPCISKNQKGIFANVGLIGNKILKKDWDNGKSIPELKIE